MQHGVALASCRSSGRYLTVAGLLLLALTATARAEKPTPQRSSWANPFASRLDPHPGRLVLNLQAASLHNDGVGVAVGYVPWGFLEIKFSYAYRTEHSVAGFAKLNVLPRAHLTPYVPLGYALGIADMRSGIRLYSHQLFAGAGLQARFLHRFFVAGEVILNFVVHQTLKDRKETYSIGPSDPTAVRVGFLVGLYLL